MKLKALLSWILRIVAALIMLQTLYFKFTAAPESVYIFSKIGIEPWGRILTGVAELVASVLLLLPATLVIGALLAVFIILGAIVTHVFILGIEVMGDHGQLFTYACIVLVCSCMLLVLHRDQLIILIKKTSVFVK